LLADLRARYEQGCPLGTDHQPAPRLAQGQPPGYNLARRLAIKADQVWLFTEVFAVPWTNNASEQALKSPKLLQKVSGNWHTTTILARFCRVRSYLISARNHGLRAIDAIHAALTGKPGCPYPRLRDSAHLAIPWNRRDSVE
jgi:hypothetical protein